MCEWNRALLLCTLYKTVEEGRTGGAESGTIFVQFCQPATIADLPSHAVVRSSRKPLIPVQKFLRDVLPMPDSSRPNGMDCD